MNQQNIEKQARDVLSQNDLGSWTQPASGHYPHQWLWDSCFVAIGLRHIDIERAKEEIRSLLRGQWQNGMLPHILFSEAEGYHAGPWLWRAHVSKNAPAGLQTSGITQPPVIAEAAVRIGEKLPAKERVEWYKEVYPAIAAYHEWLYRNRDPHRTGLVAVVHPWETGLDNTPPWMELLHRYKTIFPWTFVDKAGMTKFIDAFRKDTKHVPADQRMSTRDLYSVYRIVKQLRRNKYDDARIFKKQRILLQDLAFNCILIRANDHLKDMASLCNLALPEFTARACDRGISILEKFWDEDSKEYLSIDYRTKELIHVDSIATFLPLYAGKLPPDRVEELLQHLQNPLKFGSEYTVPTAPVNSKYFKPHCYWQGPVWINMNWLIIDGLRRNNRTKEADELKASTLNLVSGNTMNEYYSPIDGSPAGVSDFSWTAALALDLVREK